MNDTKRYDIAFYNQAVEQNLKAILGRPGVVSAGIGFKSVNNRPTQTISLVVEVAEKKANVGKSERIPPMIYGMVTDVVQQFKEETRPKMRPTVRREVKRAARSGRIDKPLNPLVGGLPIRNMGIQERGEKFEAGAIGAIVFDNEGNAMGLSVWHSIGKGGKKNDPINQPMNAKEEDTIGTLFKFDEEYDAALFKLDPEKRKYEAKVLGKDKVGIELGEPIEPYLGMEVECLACHRYATGKIYYIDWKLRKTDSKFVKTIRIQFDPGYQTQGGDSGSVWIDKNTKQPVGLHRGSNSRMRIALAGCIRHLVSNWYPFRFSDPKSKAPGKKPAVSQVEVEHHRKGVTKLPNLFSCQGNRIRYILSKAGNGHEAGHQEIRLKT